MSNSDYIRKRNTGPLPWEIEPDTRNQKEHPSFGSVEDKPQKKYPGSRLVTPSRRQIAAMVLQGMVSRDTGLSNDQLVKESVRLTDQLLKELG